MKVKFIGETQVLEIWTTQSKKGDYIIKNGDIFETCKWYGFESVLNEFDEYICDTDCDFFRENFEVLN